MNHFERDGNASSIGRQLESGARPKAYLNIEQAVDLSRDLGKRIMKLSPPPDFAIGIANGGTLPAIIAAEEAGIGYEIMKVRRKGSRLKQRFASLRLILEFFPGIMRFPPLRLLKRRFDSRFNEIEFTDWGVQTIDVVGRNVVIIDDCVDSGSTVAVVRQLLFADGASSVRVAVISWGTKYDSQELHSLVPDIYLNRIIDYYPWSLENSEYEKFPEWLESRGLRLWR